MPGFIWGRALADVDPLGVGRDMMFALDGQSSFTLFRFVAKKLVESFGLGPTVLVVTIVNMAVWFVAIVVFVRTIVPDRASVLVLATAFVLPRVYMPWNLLAAGEATAIPRPLAEAAVLLAMAALCRGRRWTCCAWLVAGAFFHPIMVAPGFGVLLLVLGLRDRRWLLAGAASIVAIVTAGALGVPLASRLIQRIDPIWLSVLRERVDYIFVSLWPTGALGPAIVRIATILIALIWFDRQTRRVLGAVIVMGILGLITSILFGDIMLDVLVIQAQPWRALWLIAALAPFAAGVCIWRLQERGAGGLIGLACLALAWIALDWYPIAPIAAVLALAAAYLGDRLVVGRPMLGLVYLICALVAALALSNPISAISTLIAQLPHGVALQWNIVWALRLPALPFLALFLIWWRWPDAPATHAGAAICVILGFVLLTTMWNSRSPAQADEDAGRRKPDLAAILDTRLGDVLWTDSDNIWYWLRRPNWDGATQGGAIVFSRDLALLWHDRTSKMVEAGLAATTMLRPHAINDSLDVPRLTRDSLMTFCATPGAPTWIVKALDANTPLPKGLAYRIWSAPFSQWRLLVTGESIRWRDFDRYALIPCAGVSSDQPRVRAFPSTSAP